MNKVAELAVCSILDQWLGLTTKRDVFTSDEVQSMLLDVRQAATGGGNTPVGLIRDTLQVAGVVES